MNDRKRPCRCADLLCGRWTSRRLLEWYERVRRPLPWRATRDPYALLVSEVMLQQTQALRVVPYYERWLAALPGCRRRWPRRRCARCSRCGPASATTGALWRCSARRAIVSAHGWPADLTGCRASARTRRRRSRRSRGIVQVAAVDTNVRRVLTRREGAAVDVPRARGELLPRGPGGDVQPGDDGARRDGLPAADAATAGRARSRAGARARSSRPSGARRCASRTPTGSPAAA